MDADVIVIGAGAAGLAAALDLARRSLRVLIVEARDRVGGRAWAAPLARASVPVELGAEFIHGRAEATRALLREARIATAETGGESWTSELGTLERVEDFSGVLDFFDGASALARDESVEQFLEGAHGEPGLRGSAELARAFVEGFDAADPAIASVKAIAAEWQSGVDFASARPIGGYAPMFAHLRRRCVEAGVTTKLSTIVRRVSWQRGAVAVDATSGSGETATLYAKAAVVTLPVGVLRHRGDETEIAFEPDLGAEKRRALGYIEAGDVVKVGMWFSTAFWEELKGGRYRDCGFFRSSGQAFPTYWTQLPLRSNLLTAWAGGPKASALRPASPDELVQRAVRGVAAMFGEASLVERELDGSAMHDWLSDPYARGAYSYIAVGGSDARATLAKPMDGTLFFAGEATSQDSQGGTVNGALETGARAAFEVAAALGGEGLLDA